MTTVEMTEAAKRANAGICRGNYVYNNQDCQKCKLNVRCMEDTNRRKEEKAKVINNNQPSIEIKANKKSLYYHFWNRMNDVFDNFKSEVKNGIEFRRYYVGNVNLCVTQHDQEGNMLIVTPSGQFETNPFNEKKEATTVLNRVFKECKVKIRKR